MNDKARQLNTTALAYIGDAVYEVYAREHAVKSGHVNVEKLHQAAVGYVNAESQAKALKAILNSLSEKEQDLVRRAKNRKVTSKPKNVDPVAYKYATAFEALIGYFYINGNQARMEEIINLAFAEIDRGAVRDCACSKSDCGREIGAGGSDEQSRQSVHSHVRKDT